MSVYQYNINILLANIPVCFHSLNLVYMNSEEH